MAVTPVHAILNYCFALLQAETRLAVSFLGLDAGLGVGLHSSRKTVRDQHIPLGTKLG